MSNMRRWRAIVFLALPVLLGIGPCSIDPRLARVPGGVLSGEVVGGRITDWSFVAEAGLCQVEVRPEFPHSVTVNCFNDGKDLYVGCMSCEGKTWSSYVSSDPRARIKIGEEIYPVHMDRVMDKRAMWAPWVSRWKKTRGTDDVPEIPDSYWLYHLTSR